MGENLEQGIGKVFTDPNADKAREFFRKKKKQKTRTKVDDGQGSRLKIRQGWRLSDIGRIWRQQDPRRGCA